MGKTAVKMPGQKKPFPLRVLVRKTAAKVSHSAIVGCAALDSHCKIAETSLGAADTSVCATYVTSKPTTPES